VFRRVTVDSQGAGDSLQLPRHDGQPMVEVQRGECWLGLGLGLVILYNCHGMMGNQWWKYNVVSAG